MDESSQRATMIVLRQIATLLRNLSPEQIDDLASGRARITIENKPTRARKGRRAPQDIPDPDLVRSKLLGLTAREEGRAYLDGLGLNKPSLQRLASTLDLPAPNTDSVDRIKDRIVEATIGYRLRSEAIRGKGQGWS